MSAMSEIDLVIDEVVSIAIQRVESWIDDDEAIDDLVAFIGIEVTDIVFNMRDRIEVDDMPFIIGHAISRALDVARPMIEFCYQVMQP